MKKIVLVLCALLAAGMFIGCSSSKKETGSAEWWHNEYLCDKIASEVMGEPAIATVGTSTLSKTTAEKAARANGRAELARRMGSTISAAAAESRGEELGEEAKQAYQDESTQIANQVLSGSAQVNYYFDENDGTTYVMIAMPLEGLDKKLQSASMKTNNKDVREFMNTLTIDQLKLMFNVK